MDVEFGVDDKVLYVAVVGGDLLKVNLPFRKAEQASYEFVSGRTSPVSYEQDLDRLATLNSEKFSILDFRDQKASSVAV